MKNFAQFDFNTKVYVQLTDTGIQHLILYGDPPRSRVEDKYGNIWHEFNFCLFLSIFGNKKFVSEHQLFFKHNLIRFDLSYKNNTSPLIICDKDTWDGLDKNLNSFHFKQNATIKIDSEDFVKAVKDAQRKVEDLFDSLKKLSESKQEIHIDL